MTTTFEDRVRVVLEAQAAGVNVRDIIPEVTSLAEERKSRRGRGTIVGVAIATAAAVIAGVVALGGDDDEQAIVTTTWGYPIEVEPGALLKFELGDIPDGYTEAPTDETQSFSTAVCTSWRVSAGKVVCEELGSSSTTRYVLENDDDDVLDGMITLATFTEPEASSETFAPNGRSAKVGEHDAWIDDDAIVWSPRDGVYGFLAWQEEGRPSDDDLVALAESVRVVENPVFSVGLKIGEVQAETEDDLHIEFGVGGTADEPCIVDFVGCASLPPQGNDLYAFEPGWLQDAGDQILVGSVDPRIRSLEVRRVDEIRTAETVELPGHSLRFFVVRPPGDDSSDLVVDFRDADGNVLATYVEGATSAPAPPPESIGADVAIADGETDETAWQLSAVGPTGTEFLESDAEVRLDYGPVGEPLTDHLTAFGGNLAFNIPLQTRSTGRLVVAVAGPSVARVDLGATPMERLDVPEWLGADVYVVEVSAGTETVELVAFGSDGEVVDRQGMHWVPDGSNGPSFWDDFSPADT